MKKDDNINLVTGKFNLDVKNSLSPLFSLAKIYVMYVGKNPNGSNISKDAVERNLNTLKNIPIVGEYVREDNNFLNHGGDLVIEDDEIRLLNTTTPIGVIPSDAVFTWEKIIDDYGEEREYLVVENAFIWNRDKKMVDALKSDSFGQSMEINVTDGVEMNDGFFDIRDFYFTALCVLGIDRNGMGYVAPAFDNANIKTYSQESSNEEFAVSLRDMFKDFKYALDDMKNLVEEDEKLNLDGILEKFSITLDELKEKVENYEELSVEEIESILEKDDEKDVVDPEVVEDVIEDVVDPVDPVDPTEPTDEPVIDEPVVSNEYEAEIALLEKENAELKSQIDELNSQVAEYSRADHERVCNEKIEEFKLSYKLDDEIVQGLDVHEFSDVDALEVKLFELVGRMASKEDFSLSAKETTKINNNLKAKENNGRIYGFEDLFNKKQ